MTTSALRLLTLALLVSLGCSAPERANRAPRCEVQSDCAEGRVCYRGFCVNGGEPVDPPTDSDDEPSTAIDASEPPSDAVPDATAPGRSSVDASVPRDTASAPTPNEASVPSVLMAPRDAEAQRPVDAAPVGPPDPAVDAGTGPGVEDASVVLPPPPPPDAGPQNNDDLQPELNLCLLRCRNNEAVCYNCFRRIVQEHPEVCTAEDPMGVDALVKNLCGILCPSPGSCSSGGGR